MKSYFNKINDSLNKDGNKAYAHEALTSADILLHLSV